MPAAEMKQAAQMVEIQGASPVAPVAGEDFQRVFAANLSAERGSAPSESMADGSRGAKASVSVRDSGESGAHGQVAVSPAKLEKAPNGSEASAGPHLKAASTTFAVAPPPSESAKSAGRVSGLAAANAGNAKSAARPASAGVKSSPALTVTNESAEPVIAGKFAAVELSDAEAGVQSRSAQMAEVPPLATVEHNESANRAVSSKEPTNAARGHDDKHVRKADSAVSTLPSFASQTVVKGQTDQRLQPIELVQPGSIPLPDQGHSNAVAGEELRINPVAMNIVVSAPPSKAAAELRSHAVASIVVGNRQTVPSIVAGEVNLDSAPERPAQGRYVQIETDHEGAAVDSALADVNTLPGTLPPQSKAAANVTGAHPVRDAEAVTTISENVSAKAASKAETLSASLASPASAGARFTHSLGQVAANPIATTAALSANAVGARDVLVNALKGIRETPGESAQQAALPATTSAASHIEDAGGREPAASSPATVFAATAIEPKRTSADAKSSGPSADAVEVAGRGQRATTQAQGAPGSAAANVVRDSTASADRGLSSTMRVEPPADVDASSTGDQSAVVANTNVIANGIAAIPTSPLASASVLGEVVCGGSPAPASVAGIAARLSAGTVPDVAMAGDAHRTLIATPTTLEVVVPDAGRGWLKIRADVGGEGGVTASLAAASSGGQEVLKGQLPALNAYLHNEHMAVTTTVAERSFAASASGLAGLTSGAEGSTGSNTQGHSHRHGGQGAMDGGLLQGDDGRQPRAGYNSEPGQTYGSGTGAPEAGVVSSGASSVSALMGAEPAPLGENGHRLNVRV